VLLNFEKGSTLGYDPFCIQNLH